MGATGFTVERLEERRHGHELEEAHPEDDLPAIAAAPQVKKNDPGQWQRDSHAFFTALRRAHDPSSASTQCCTSEG